jgi:hypothetical protein
LITAIGGFGRRITRRIQPAPASSPRKSVLPKPYVNAFHSDARCAFAIVAEYRVVSALKGKNPLASFGHGKS